MIKEIKELRVKIDGLSQLVKELKVYEVYHTKGLFCNSGYVKEIQIKELEKAYDSLILSKAWLGKVLGELGNENPYKSGYKTKEDIVPTQDVVGKIIVKYPDSLLCEPDPKNGSEPNSRVPSHIEKVDWLRQEIEKLIKIIIELAIPLAHTRELAIARTQTYISLCEAKFWLGLELSRIKNEK